MFDPLKRPAGHCDSDEHFVEFTTRLQEVARPYAQMTDFALANAVFMADRNDFDLMAYQTAAKERIRWLSVHLAMALQRADKAETLLEGIERGTIIPPKVTTGADGNVYEAPEGRWTCFHCGHTFLTHAEARKHFGATPDTTPACIATGETV